MSMLDMLINKDLTEGMVFHNLHVRKQPRNTSAEDSCVILQREQSQQLGNYVPLRGM
jgi:hypothetical protein